MGPVQAIASERLVYRVFLPGQPENLFLRQRSIVDTNGGVFKSGQTACPMVIQKANSTPLFHKHQLTRAELLLSRPDTFPWLRALTPALQPVPNHQ